MLVCALQDCLSDSECPCAQQCIEGFCKVRVLLLYALGLYASSRLQPLRCSVWAETLAYLDKEDMLSTSCSSPS